MASYALEPDEHTLHGFFSPDLAPVLTIESGDTVRFRTLDADWGLEPFTAYVPPGPPQRRRVTTKAVRHRARRRARLGKSGGRFADHTNG
jgi:hypothetical protein